MPFISGWEDAQALMALVQPSREGAASPPELFVFLHSGNLNFAEIQMPDIYLRFISLKVSRHR